MKLDISNEELTERLALLTGKEREVTLKFLIHLAEFEERKLHLEAGYSSLFDYCVRKLKLSDGSAYRRVWSARYLKANPTLKENFLKGEVTLCSMAAGAKALKEEINIDIVGKSKREIEGVIQKVAPVLKPKETIKEIYVKEKIDELPLFGISSPAEPIEERFEISFSVSKEIFEEFQGIKQELSNKAGKALSIEEIFKNLINNSKPAKERKIRDYNQNSRAIPLSLKREIFKECSGQCSYTSPDGIRCTEVHHLEFDHIKPFGICGKTTKDNLRLLCSNHNKFMAERTFGKRIRQ